MSDDWESNAAQTDPSESEHLAAFLAEHFRVSGGTRSAVETLPAAAQHFSGRFKPIRRKRATPIQTGAAGHAIDDIPLAAPLASAVSIRTRSAVFTGSIRLVVTTT